MMERTVTARPDADAAGSLPSLVERQATGVAQSHRIAARLRERIVAGTLKPGAHLSEAALSEELDVSRNTLREAFRVLAKEGILNHEVNRGVFVSIPSTQTIVDVYRVRRLVQCAALAQGYAGHPGAVHMRATLQEAERCRGIGDWLGVGSADIAYHAAIVELADSPRLSAFFGQVLLELRLVFGLLPNAEHLHAPFVDRNRAILGLLEDGRPAEAAQALETYLGQAERLILSAYSPLSK